MSAIAGVYYTDGRLAGGAHLGRMMASLAHRGPDGSGFWCDGGVGLGHRMLWTTPESLDEKQPLVSRDGNLVITADARIDNRDDLGAALGKTLRPRDGVGGVSDSELILAAYEKWGGQCPERLIGDFAFAIWDARHQSLFCARDPMGIVPFYYYRTRRFFAFASEIKALLSLPEVARRLNETKVADYLEGLYEDETITFYQDVFRLPKAHRLTVSREAVRLDRYWSFDTSRELRLRTDAEYAEAFRGIFVEAVRCRLRSAYPVGSLLSGGLDSSSIACTARQLSAGKGGRPFPTFSAIFPDLPDQDLKELDERKYMDSVLALGGFESHYIRADRLGPFAELERVLWHEDEAVFAPNLYMHWAAYRAAHQAGVRVLLDGIDGDSTVSYGFDYLTELARRGRWRVLVAEARALADRTGNPSYSTKRIVWEYGFEPLIPELAFRVWRRLRRRRPPTRAFNPLINPAFSRRVGLEERARLLQGNGQAEPGNARKKHAMDLSSGLWDYGMEIVNKATGAFPLEARYPFFDRRLMEFCVSLPLRQKLNQGWSRIILRRAMAGILPEEVRWRAGKANLSPNFKRGLLSYGRSMLEEVILNDPGAIEDYVDVNGLRAVYQRYVSQLRQREPDALALYSVVMLAVWLRKSGLRLRTR